MPRNMLAGFKLFVEKSGSAPPDEGEDTDKYVSTVKKQFGVPKAIFMGMPLLLSNTKLGDHMITDPTTFYVSDFDASSVTLTNVPKPGYGEDAEGTDDADDDDPDGEIDMDKDNIKGHIEVTIDRDDFYGLQEPQGAQAAGGAGGDMGGMGGMM